LPPAARSSTAANCRFSGSEDNLKLIRDPRVLAAYKLQTTSDGVLLGLRYVVRAKGKVELGTDTCAMCHVHILPDGKVVEGPANVHTPFGPLMGDLTRRYASISPQLLEDRRRKHMREDYRVPFLKDDPNLPVADLAAEEIARLYDANPLGVHARTNTSLLYPVKIANLIGLRDIKYFDRTGTSRHRNIQDLMRYCGMIADVSDALTHYGDGPDSSMRLANMGLAGGVKRTPDALLYALALYIYSLEPPANPNPVNADARRGQAVFQSAGCGNCHTPGLYANNRLTIAKGFTPPPTLPTSCRYPSRRIPTSRSRRARVPGSIAFLRCACSGWKPVSCMTARSARWRRCSIRRGSNQASAPRTGTLSLPRTPSKATLIAFLKTL
jgi:hypothetical protein